MTDRRGHSSGRRCGESRRSGQIQNGLAETIGLEADYLRNARPGIPVLARHEDCGQIRLDSRAVLDSGRTRRDEWHQALDHNIVVRRRRLVTVDGIHARARAMLNHARVWRAD